MVEEFTSVVEEVEKKCSVRGAKCRVNDRLDTTFSYDVDTREIEYNPRNILTIFAEYSKLGIVKNLNEFILYEIDHELKHREFMDEISMQCPHKQRYSGLVHNVVQDPIILVKLRNKYPLIDKYVKFICDVSTLRRGVSRLNEVLELSEEETIVNEFFYTLILFTTCKLFGYSKHVDEVAKNIVDEKVREVLLKASDVVAQELRSYLSGQKTLCEITNDVKERVAQVLKELAH